MNKRPADDQTRAVHAASGPRSLLRTVNPPVQRGSTVLAPKAENLYDGSKTYGRSGLEPHGALCEALSELQGASGTCLFPSGLAAITGTLMALLRAGDDILVVDSIYDPSRRFCDTHLKRFGVTARYFDPVLPPAEVLAMAGDATRLLLLESPGSLTFDVLDVEALAEGARAKGLLAVIDATYGAGVLDKPLAKGADVTVQALTKYVGGHADAFMGAASAREASVLKRLQASQLQIGWACSPDDAYLMLRGVRTLPMRLDRHGRSALQVSHWLTAQPQVQAVINPALPGAPGHELFRRQFSGPNGLFSIVLQPGPEAAVLAFLDRLELFGLGFSWGGFESLAIHCDPQFGRRTVRRDFGGPVVRLHIGLESPEDLIADLAGALDVYSANI